VDPKNIVGGGNLAPEVLKMLQQQMAPSTAQVNDADEPDEIKVPHLPHNTIISDFRSFTPQEHIPN
jgi:hypothetical protein